MGLRRALVGLGAGAPVPVFPVLGRGGRRLVRWLWLDDSVELVDSPRAASVLLVAGRLPPQLLAPAMAVHDEVAPPRVTVCWGGDIAAFPHAVEVPASQDPVPKLRRLAREVALSGVGEPPLRPDVDPNPWREVGPFGQGGTGMTGGNPYGRPMADRAPDRDGLRLDQLPVSIGPFFSAFPPGLRLDVKLQGDIVQDAAASPNPYAGMVDGPSQERSADVFRRALTAPVPIAELELARGRSHLLWLADALRVAGLNTLGRRARRLAHQITAGSAEEVERLRRLLSLSQVLRWSLPPKVKWDCLDEAGLGPVARAAGRCDDVRQHDPGYRRLGFEPIVQHGGGVAALWRQRLDEVAQAVTLAARAGDGCAAVRGEVEAPRGRLVLDGVSPSSRLLQVVPDLVAGLEWGDAVAVIGSLDLDLEEAAGHRATEQPVHQGHGGPP